MRRHDREVADQLVRIVRIAALDPGEVVRRVRPLELDPALRSIDPEQRQVDAALALELKAEALLEIARLVPRHVLRPQLEVLARGEKAQALHAVERARRLARRRRRRPVLRVQLHPDDERRSRRIEIHHLRVQLKAPRAGVGHHERLGDDLDAAAADDEKSGQECKGETRGAGERDHGNFLSGEIVRVYYEQWNLVHCVCFSPFLALRDGLLQSEHKWSA